MSYIISEIIFQVIFLVSRLEKRGFDCGRQFSEIKVKKMSFNVRDRMKFAKITRNDLLCTKMKKIMFIENLTI